MSVSPLVWFRSQTRLTYGFNPAQSQYVAASRVPLIKSPSLRVPRPVRRQVLEHAHGNSAQLNQVELPPDIHPLPDSVTPYASPEFLS